MKNKPTPEQKKELTNLNETIRVFEFQGRIYRAEKAKLQLKEYIIKNNLELN